MTIRWYYNHDTADDDDDYFYGFFRVVQHYTKTRVFFHIYHGHILNITIRIIVWAARSDVVFL